MINIIEITKGKLPMKQHSLCISAFVILSALVVGALSASAVTDKIQADHKKNNETETSAMSIYDFAVNDIDGAPVKLDQYRGQVVMIVNVASKCGFTPQYEGLQKLYTTYKDSGLVILGFPANNFLHQEPGTDAEIKSFCSMNFGVTFPMFSKISVKGKEQHPLYAYLTDKKKNGEFGGDIGWNFTKFLIGRDGQIVGRFGSRTKPDDAELVEAVKKALAQPR
jgi:glutathione peroxidase-family protein